MPDHVSFALSTVGWGWHADTATHVLRLILGGVFDGYPDLQIIIGHMGETLPFMLPRFDTVLPPGLTRLRRPVSAYLRENVSYTFADFNDQATFANLLAQVGIDRIMFSADYPFGSMAEGREFLDALPIGRSDPGEDRPQERRETAAHVRVSGVTRFRVCGKWLDLPVQWEMRSAGGPAVMRPGRVPRRRRRLGLRGLRPRHREPHRRDPAHYALHRPPNDAYDTAAIIHLADYQK